MPYEFVRFVLLAVDPKLRFVKDVQHGVSLFGVVKTSFL